MEQMQACKFTFDIGPVWDGFAHGSTWNGFDNVAVTKETLEKMTEFFRTEAEKNGHDQDEAVEAFVDVMTEKPMTNGLYSLGWGFAAQIVNEPMTFEQFIATKTWIDDLMAFDGWQSDGAPEWSKIPKPRGYIYVGQISIEEVLPHWPGNARGEGRWYLRLANWEKITDDIDSLEREAYKYAVANGLCDPVTT